MEPIDVKALKMHYLKNSDYKTVFATGFIGGATYNGLINVHIVTDRNPIPQSITMDMTTNPPKEVSKETKTGIIREVPVGLLMDRKTAESLKDWLIKNIEILDNAIKESKNTQAI